MNRLFLINEEYYVVAFDYYDAITKFKNYRNQYDENIIEKIELVSEDIISNIVKQNGEEETEEEY